MLLHQLFDALAKKHNTTPAEIMAAMGYNTSHSSNIRYRMSRKPNYASPRMRIALTTLFPDELLVKAYFDPTMKALDSYSSNGEVWEYRQGFDVADLNELSKFCIDGLHDRLGGVIDIKVHVAIYTWEEPDTKDGLMQELTTVICGAEEFNLMEDYVSGLQALYKDWGHDPVTRIKVLGYTQRSR